MKLPLAKCAFAATVLLASACASNNVIVDTQGVDPARYAQDKQQCDAYASQVNTGGQVAKSAGFGAALGAAVAAIFGDSKAVVRGAGAGGVVGGAKGAIQGDNEKEQVVRNCLRGRGYRVLN